MAGASIFHWSKLLKLAFLFIQDVEIVENYSTEIVLLLLSSTHVDLVEHLNRSKFSGQFFNV